MKVYELLNMASPIIQKLIDAGVNIKYIDCLDIYSEYEEMKDNGDKVVYIASHLCEKHQITEYKFYNMLKVFKAEV